MSFSQQSRSDIAAAEADERRRRANEAPQFHDNRDPEGGDSPRRKGVIAKLRAWARSLFSR